MKSEEDALFVIGWSLTGIALLFFILLTYTPIPVSRLMLPCLFHSLLGLYCPGCGGTRAVIALFQGRLLTSFYYHPIVLYSAVMGGWFLLSQTIERISRHRLRIGMKYRRMYLWLALVILFVNFTVKNMLLVIWKIDLL